MHPASTVRQAASIIFKYIGMILSFILSAFLHKVCYVILYLFQETMDLGNLLHHIIETDTQVLLKRLCILGNELAFKRIVPNNSVQ